MYRISQLMSTPVASSGSEKEHTGELSPTCIFPSFACDFPDGDSSFECCSIDPVTGSHLTCRRSPRFLTNGYYLWTEDSFLCGKDGNIALSPSHTSVTYKESLVRIFRKKKRARRSLSSLFNISVANSWLHGSICGEADSSPSEALWLGRVRRLDTDHCNENGGDFVCPSLPDDWEPGKQNVESAESSFSSHMIPEPPRESSPGSSPQTHLTASQHFQETIWDRSRTSLLDEVSFQAILLAVCLIISACARWFLEGILASFFTCSLVIAMAYVVKSLFLSLVSYFRATTSACLIHTIWRMRPLKTETTNVIFVSILKLAKSLPKFDKHSGVPLMNAFNLHLRKLSNLQSTWNQLLYWQGARKWMNPQKHFNLAMQLF
ncbi:transmembrane protein 71 isoform X2 [Tamandua tetradactyla]|uniref:transmembrane protein 71 isoform X2 n=1 Tax=Tamandua tetradactyla TaxID=48850 RepID=UPI0040542502